MQQILNTLSIRIYQKNNIKLFKEQEINMFLLLLFLILGINSNAYSQKIWNPININGSISYSEITDTAVWKTITLEDNIIVRENNEAYYLAMNSNIYTSMNLYLKKKTTIQVLHISYSLGDSHYIFKNDSWVAIDEKYHWKFRDPVLRDTTGNDNLSKEIRDYYINSIDLIEEQNEFYKNNLWIANTMTMGSYSEIEVIISKKLIDDIKNVYASYIYKNGYKRSIHFFPKNIESITSNPNLDAKLQSGDLPEINQFTFQ